MWLKWTTPTKYIAVLMRLYITNVIQNSFMTVPSCVQDLNLYTVEPFNLRYSGGHCCCSSILHHLGPGMYKNPANIRNLNSKSSRILSTKSPTHATSWIVGEKLTCILNRPKFWGSTGCPGSCPWSKNRQAPIKLKRDSFSETKAIYHK